MTGKPYPRITSAFNGPPTVASMGDSGLLQSTTVKRLKPGAPGTKRLLERYGSALVCVRYRLDGESGRRFTTIEIAVEERPAPANRDVWVRVGYEETELRLKIKKAGGTWDKDHKLWRLPAKSAKALQLQNRIVENFQ
ncbi:MAG TPA: hypothetical protein VFY24_04440 [Azospira sp.]|nr:hypothetical protein [Azospira sp.]